MRGVENTTGGLMVRPSGWDVLGLDGDPTPGVVESVQDLAKRFGDFAHDVESAYGSLNGFGADANALGWVGQTAEAFKGQFGPLPGRLQKLYVSYSEASDALSAYAPKLQSAQAKADSALRQALDAQVDLQRATASANNAAADLKTAQQHHAANPNPNPQAVTDAQTAHDNAQTGLKNAQARMDALKAQAHQAHDDLDSAAKDCAKALHHAQSDGIHNKHWWQHVGEDLAKLGGIVAEYAGDVSMVLSVIAPVLDVIAASTIEIPGLDVITGGLAIIATAAGTAYTAGTAAKMAGDGLEGHYRNMLGDAALLAQSRLGGKGKGGEPGEDGLPPGAMAAHEPVAGINDPSYEKGPLGEDFAPGVHDPDGNFKPHEVSVADRLAQGEGWSVHSRRERQEIQGLQNPDVMVRKDPDDPGKITEFKQLNSGSIGAVKRNINKAGSQGDTEEAVIDGRKVGLDELDAQAGYRGAKHQPGGKIPDVVHVILGDDRLITFRKGED